MLPPEMVSRLSPIAAVKENESIARHVTLRIGGPADAYILANSSQKLREIVNIAREYGVDFIVIGGGSNLLVDDGGFRGLVIENSNLKGHNEPIHILDGGEDTCLVKVESGVPLARLAYFLSRKGWGGLEWAVGIPGTVGGGVVNNAGAHGGSMGGVVQSICLLERDDVLKEVSPAELEYRYRYSNLRYRWREQGHRPVVLGATLRLSREDTEALQKRITFYSARRRSSQPSQSSAGSMFKNPSVQAAGWLIEQVGLKGKRIGDAQISNRHANFIVNRGHAVFSEVDQLMKMAKEKVFHSFGVELEEEVERVGESAHE